MKLAAAVLDLPARNDLQPYQQCLGEGPAVRLDEADDDVCAALFAPPALLEHLVRLANAGCGPEVYAKLSASHDSSSSGPVC